MVPTRIVSRRYPQQTPNNAAVSSVLMKDLPFLRCLHQFVTMEEAKGHYSLQISETTSRAWSQQDKARQHYRHLSVIHCLSFRHMSFENLKIHFHLYTNNVLLHLCTKPQSTPPLLPYVRFTENIRKQSAILLWILENGLTTGPTLLISKMATTRGVLFPRSSSQPPSSLYLSQETTDYWEGSSEATAVWMS